jgi:hypothetical protein
MSQTFPESLCHGCVRLRRVESKRGSVFLMCTDPALAKYPPQPVRSCERRVPIE